MKNNTFRDKLLLLPKAIVLPILLLSSIGFIMMYDAALGTFSTYCKKQMIYFALFLQVMFLAAFVNIKFIFKASYYIYIAALILLCITALTGHKAMGATRWINLGFFKFQPSELMKISIVLALAKYFHTVPYSNVNKLKYLLTPILLVLIPFLITVKQPDLGTGMVIAFSGVVIFYLAGINMGKFIVAMIMIAIATPFIWDNLHDYQKKRILTFLDPERDPLGAGYNVIQSKIAIGSGGLFGKGIMEGTQAKLDFLPEHQTDFIFPVFAEEFGFIGSMVLLSLFLMLTLKSLHIGINHKQTFGRLVVFGLTSIFVAQIFINLGMTMGLLPAKGIPLPFISYGGTSLGAMLISFGIIMNISMNNNRIIA